MEVKSFFLQEKGITVDAAFLVGGKYTAVDVCRFAEKYHEQAESKSIENALLKALEIINHEKAQYTCSIRGYESSQTTDEDGYQRDKASEQALSDVARILQTEIEKHK